MITSMIKETAVAYRIALDHGWIPLSVVEKWADGLIAERDKPEPWIVDLSYSATEGKAEAANVLDCFPGDWDRDQMWNVLKPLLLHQLYQGAKSATEIIEELDEDLKDSTFLSDEVSCETGALWMEHEMALIGNQSMDRVERRLREFLK